MLTDPTRLERRDVEGPASSARYEVALLPSREQFWFRALLYVWSAVAITYTVWRFTVVNWQVWLGPATYMAEVVGIVITFMFLVITHTIRNPEARASTVPRVVDALIPTYNEPLSVVEPTVAAALAVRGIRRVFILDDGNRPEVARMSERVGAHYIARGENTHAKAGNMNNGLRHTDAEFILALDADHAPFPAFLEKTLGYFDDESVAFVQTPQTFHNTDSLVFRPTRNGLWSENHMFYGVIQPGKNRSNASFYVGTSAVLRRAAIEDVGGFSTETATEDVHTSLRMHANGWRSVFVPEAMASGLEPESLKEYFRQRRRWAAGSMGLLFRSADSPLVKRGLTLAQRFNYLSATTSHLHGVHKLFFFLLPVFCLFMLQSPIRPNLLGVIPVIAGFFLFSLGIIAIHARGRLHLIHTEAYKLSLFPAQIAGLWAILRPNRKLAPARKRLAGVERSRVKAVYWVLLLLAFAAAGRAASVLSGAAPADIVVLVSVSLVILFVNTVELTSFVGFIELYERRQRREARTSASEVGPAQRSSRVPARRSEAAATIAGVGLCLVVTMAFAAPSGVAAADDSVVAFRHDVKAWNLEMKLQRHLAVAWERGELDQATAWGEIVHSENRADSLMDRMHADAGRAEDDKIREALEDLAALYEQRLGARRVVHRALIRDDAALRAQGTDLERSAAEASIRLFEERVLPLLAEGPVDPRETADFEQGLRAAR